MWNVGWNYKPFYKISTQIRFFSLVIVILGSITDFLWIIIWNMVDLHWINITREAGARTPCSPNRTYMNHCLSVFKFHRKIFNSNCCSFYFLPLSLPWSYRSVIFPLPFYLGVPDCSPFPSANVPQRS